MWEEIKDHTNGDIYRECDSSRLKVPGGWIVRTIYSTGSTSGGTSVAQTFVPDLGHVWKL